MSLEKPLPWQGTEWEKANHSWMDRIEGKSFSQPILCFFPPFYYFEDFKEFYFGTEG